MTTKEYIYIRIGGVNLKITSDLKEERDALRSAFRYHLTEEGKPAKVDHTIEFRGSLTSAVPQDSKKVWQGVYHAVGHKGVHDNIVTKYLSNDNTKEYYETADGECIITDLESMTTECVLKEKKHRFRKGTERSQVGSLMILMIHTVMSYHRRYSLHASSVVHNGKAILFTGRSGQGKSTLSTDLASLGAGFLGDDIVFLYRENGELHVGSLLFEAKLFENNCKDKLFIDVIAKYNGEVIDSMPLGGFCEVIQTRSGETYVEKAPDQDRLMEMLLNAANNIAMQYDKEDWLETCGCLLTGYELQNVMFGDRKQLSRRFLDKITG